MEKNAKIYVSGHRGMLGSAMMRRLEADGYTNIITRTHKELDLTRQADVEGFFAKEAPEYVFLAAAKVGGIMAMSAQPVEFLSENLRIQCNVIDAAHKYQTKKLIFISSASAYPVAALQPIKEEYILTGEVDPSGEGYSIAKIAGIRCCAYYQEEYGSKFLAVVPANIYGPNGIFDRKFSHVIPAMIRRFHSAKVHNRKEVVIWGSGNARRELIYVSDVADACIHLMKNDTDNSCYNIGYGSDLSMMEIAETVKQVVGFDGIILCDSTKPEGAMKRLLDSSRMNQTGWYPEINFEQGIKLTYQWFLENIEDKDELYL